MTRYTVANRLFGILLLPVLLIVVGLWQAGHLWSRFRAWWREHVLG